jgi:hypothetical protein
VYARSWCRWSSVASGDVTVLGRVGRAPALALWVDPTVHAAEVARFRAKIVAGPGDGDCSIWIGSIGADGYGRYFITRAGMGFCVRPNRYALALATGSAVGADVFALHECDNPLCVKVSGPEALCEHVVAGTQFDNIAAHGAGPARGRSADDSWAGRVERAAMAAKRCLRAGSTRAGRRRVHRRSRRADPGRELVGVPPGGRGFRRPVVPVRRSVLRRRRRSGRGQLAG